MITVVEFDADFVQQLPQTYQILRDGGLTIHGAVERVTLHGSRGLTGGARPEADLDLCLLVDDDQLTHVRWEEELLESIITTTLSHWKGTVELDLAAVFDLRKCGLRCFNCRQYDKEACSCGGIDCFGIFKTQQGYHGYIVNAGIDIKSIYPCSLVWKAG